MNTRFLPFIILLFLFACKQSPNIEVIEYNDKIYLPEYEADVPDYLFAEMFRMENNKSIDDEMQKIIKDIVKKLEQEKGSMSDIYSFGYRLYVGEDGEIEKVTSIMIDIPGGKVYSPQSDITELLLPEIGEWKFQTLKSKYTGNNIKFRSDIKKYVVNSNGNLNVKEADKIVNMAKFDMNFDDKDYLVDADEMPSPIGGFNAIQENIVYPAQAKRLKTHGRVFITAFINENGKVDNAELFSGIGNGCDEAALNAVMKTKFNPGKKNGKPVKVQAPIPIVFKLD